MQKTLASVMGVAVVLSAGGASAAEKSTYQQRGTLASVSASQQVDSCRSWSVFSSLAETSVKDEPGSTATTNTATVSFNAYDDCNSSFSSFFINLADVAQFQGNLNSASVALNTPVTVTSCTYSDEGAECIESTAQLTGSLTWSASGGLEKVRNSVVNQSNGVLTRFRSTGSGRESTVSGTLSFNGQTYTVTDDNVAASSLTGNSLGFVSFTRK